MNDDERIPQLVESFINAAIKHQVLSLKDWKTANREAKELQRIFLELKSIGRPGREALLALVKSEKPSVALMASVYSLKYDTKKSMKTLKSLAKEADFIGFQAEQAIKRWEEGTWNIE
jgi:hypothetical protein